MVRYVFFSRLFLEFLPTIVDMILVSTSDVTLTTYIGPYPNVGFSMECCVSTFFYYKVLTKNTYSVTTSWQRQSAIRSSSQSVPSQVRPLDVPNL
ncbi:hypothetical protein QR680_016314 [Steinernema hermaphroditum]|uniref:Secreted protein n=1 Tax=Steinernema hermaphroditum TaxID=289476 RepID=A0AA39HBX4_9BILA|nr:hypothetical protein QR680_016314 [Steinernema hermaphroditum]